MLVIFVPDGLDLGTAICAPWKHETLITLKTTVLNVITLKKNQKNLKHYLIFIWYMLEELIEKENLFNR